MNSTTTPKDLAPEATAAINDYLDRVRMALPLSPSARLAAADRLYHEIVSACSEKAQQAGKTLIDADVVEEHLATLGDPVAKAQAMTSETGAGAWTWPGDYFADALRHHRVAERVDKFARAAAEHGEHAARVSMDAAASALDIAAKKLREAAERLKNRQ